MPTNGSLVSGDDFECNLRCFTNRLRCRGPGGPEAVQTDRDGFMFLSHLVRPKVHVDFACTCVSNPWFLDRPEIAYF